MKLQLFLKGLFLFFCVNLFAQVKFEKGYLIDNQNKKVECLIKNKDWISVPNEIEYKLFDSSPVISVLVKDLNELRIDNTSHYYKKYTVLIDKNTEVNEDHLVEETSFFKVLVDGKASLFQYNNESLFFYETPEIKIKQLKYKSYVDNDKIRREDTSFRKELFGSLKCEAITFQKAIKLTYEKAQLVKFFKAYNECKGSDYQDLTKRETKIKFNFKILAGVNINNSNTPVAVFFKNPPSTGSDEYQENKGDVESGSKVNLSLGFEAELLLPFNKNKWSLFASPNYQQFKYESSKILKSSYGASGTVYVNNQYSFIEVPIGVRHYFNLNEKSKLFVDVAYALIIFTSKSEKSSFESLADYQFPGNEKNSKDFMTFRIGAGYNYNNKYSLSINYSKKQLSQSEVNAFSLLVSYKL